ncbi:MAG: hypothetical protein ACRYFX_27990 [Janthinobacterium lividum]
MKPASRWRALWLFYRSVAPALAGISLLVFGLAQLPTLADGHPASLVKLLVLKVLVTPAAWYLSERTRPHQYWLYLNLGLSRRVLWGSAIGLDALLFAGAAAGINSLFL